VAGVLLFTLSTVMPAYAAIPGVPASGNPSGIPTQNSLTISWTASSNSPTGYQIEWAEETSFGVFDAWTDHTANTANTDITKTITGLNPGQFWKFRISGINGDGTSSPSPEFFAGTLHDANQNFSNSTQQFTEGQFFGNGTIFAQDQFFKGTQTFGFNQTFSNGTQFAASQNFTNYIQTFTGTNTFGDGTMFAQGQTFDTLQIFGDNMDFDFALFNFAQTFGAGANFTGNQTFTGSNTFGTNAVFGTGQTFPTTQTFGAGANFTGNTDFSTNQIFAATSHFADAQQFPSDEIYNFIAAGMTFGSGTDFGKARTFGTDMNFTSGNQTFIGTNVFGDNAHFASNQVFGSTDTFGVFPSFNPGTKFNAAMTWGINANFTGIQTFLVDQIFGRGAHFDTAQNFTSSTHNFDAFDMTFGANTLFPSDETFGTGANFTGTINFPNNQVFPVLAEFAASQDFPSGETVTFNDFAKFGSGSTFGTARTFEEFTFFDGTQTFVGSNTFKEGTHFGAAQAFTASQTFGAATFFGTNTDFSTLDQTFGAGTKFDTGTLFNNGQTLASGLIPAYGLLLEGITCPADGTCIPDASKYLAPGELLAPGTDPTAIANTISNKTTSFTIPGLGFEMSFANVTTSGKVNVDPIDPSTLTTSTAGSTLGSRTVTASGTSITTIGTVMNVSLDTAIQSGTMTITLPYDESNIPAGVTEENLEMVHFTGEAWVTENNCSVDTVNNKITCTVTSLSPFGIGAGSSGSISGSGGGGDNIAPSFTTTFSEDDYPLRIFDVDYSLSMIENIPTKMIKTGESIQIELNMYDNGGPQNVQHVDMYVNQKGDKILNDRSETVITYDSEDIELQDPYNLIQSANVVSSVLGNKVQFLFDVSFAKAMDTSDILFRVWDLNRNVSYLHIPDALEVNESGLLSGEQSSETSEILEPESISQDPTFIPEPLISTDFLKGWAGFSSESISDPEFLSHVGLDGQEIPNWVKQNIPRWVLDGQITQQEFVNALEYLVN